MDTFSDYLVEYRSEDDIKHLADQCRRLGGIDRSICFNIVNFLRHSFKSPNSKKGKLLFAVVPEYHPNPLPYVEYKPLTLFSTQRLLNRAETGDPLSRFKLAHEIGHIVMHDHYARSFSNDPSLQISFAENERSAEWQANIFAKYFLLPDWILYSLRTSNRIILDTQVPAPLFEERINDITLLNAARGVDFSSSLKSGQFAISFE